MRHIDRWFTLILMFVIISAVVLNNNLQRLEQATNDSQNLTYEQMECIDFELAYLNEKIMPTKIYVESLGMFHISYYCNDCDACGTNNVTKDGTTLTEESMSVAVDKSIIPIGTKLLIEGVEFVANDTGGEVQGKDIDIMVYGKSHEEVNAMGIDNIEVYKILDIAE